MDFSILIGLVSTEDTGRIFECLNALQNQEGAHSYEVIIADRRNNDVSKRLDNEYPEVKRFSCPSHMSLPELRTLALDKANGTYIIVTEDHTVPSNNWLASMAQAFTDSPEGTVAVGGCVENGVDDTPFDWATFLCEYSYFLESIDEGTSKILPGMNIAYHRSIFDSIEHKLLTSGFWETTVHPILLAKGLKFFSTNKIKLYHCKKFSFGLFAKQRFIYSRYYAGLRYGRWQLFKRFFACAATVLLPALLLLRSSKQMKAKNRLAKEFKLAIPNLLVFYVIWACGEMFGYVFGSGDALRKIE